MEKRLQNQNLSKGDGLLYHYTKRDSFFKILESLCLKPSRFVNLNDLNEGGFFSLYNMDAFRHFEVKRIIEEDCSMISFVHSNDSNEIPQCGTNRPSMWAYYANNSDGVCFVIDEKKFIEKNRQLIEKYWGHIEDVDYQYINTKSEIIQKNTAEDTIKTNYRDLFFRKYEDWKHENERRLLLVGLNPEKEMLSIDGCIVNIVMGQRFWRDYQNICAIIDRISNPKYCCYHKFIPHQFKMMTISQHGYDADDAAFKFTTEYEYKYKGMNQQKESYLNWLKQEGY